MSELRRLIQMLAKQRLRLAIAVVAMVSLAVSNGLYPVLIDLLTTSLFTTGGAIDNPWIGRIEQLLSAFGISADLRTAQASLGRHVLAFFFTVVSVKAVSQAVRFHEMGVIAQRFTRDLRNQFFSSLVRQDVAFFEGRPTGVLISHMTNNIARVERAATYALPVLIGDALKVIVLAGMCVFEYGRLSLIALAVLPAAALPIVLFGKLLKRYGRQSQDALADLTHRVSETLGGMRVVKASGGEAFEEARFGEVNGGYYHAMWRSVLVRALQTPVMELVGITALLVTLLWAESEVAAGNIRPGEVVAFLLALVLMYEPLKAVGRVNAIIMPGLAAAEQVFETLDARPEVVERPDASELAPMQNAVELVDVGFSYASDPSFALRGITLRLDKGKTVALVGPSGGGKSTIAKLLPRFYDVSAGHIRVDGVDVKDVTLESLRRQIAVVSQDNFLFDDTVRANIAYARPDATDEQVQAAARAAHAHEFVEALPKGYATKTGERGVQLSGGQRQRIAIARAFLEDAPVLLLDEATSALDTESEREVQKALDKLVTDRTTLVIAHRLSTVKKADEILVVDGGAIVERGTHESLMADGGLYRRLVEEEIA